MTQVSEDAAFVRYPPPALSQRARGFQPLLPVKVAGGGCEGIIKKFAKKWHLRGHYQKVGNLGGIHPLGGHRSDAPCEHSKHSEGTKPG